MTKVKSGNASTLKKLDQLPERLTEVKSSRTYKGPVETSVLSFNVMYTTRRLRSNNSKVPDVCTLYSTVQWSPCGHQVVIKCEDRARILETEYEICCKSI